MAIILRLIKKAIFGWFNFRKLFSVGFQKLFHISVVAK
jgi:hypothetical protein